MKKDDGRFNLCEAIEAALDLDNKIVQRLCAESEQALRKNMTGALHLMGYDAASAAECKFDEDTIRRIEQELDHKYRDRVLKWTDESLSQIARIRTLAGVATSSPAHVIPLNNIVHCHGVLFAYCLANCIDGQLEVNEEGMLAVVPSDPALLSAFPVGKAFKYLKNGREDSLLGMLTATRMSGAVDDEFQEQMRVLKAGYREVNGEDFPKGYRIQKWHDADTGELVRIVVLDKNGKQLAQCSVA